MLARLPSLARLGQAFKLGLHLHCAGLQVKTRNSAIAEIRRHFRKHFHYLSIKLYSSPLMELMIFCIYADFVSLCPAV